MGKFHGAIGDELEQNPGGEGWWASIPSWAIPRPVERLAYRLANPVDDIRKSMTRFNRVAGAAFDAEQVQPARKIHITCMLAAVAFSVLTFLINLNTIISIALGVA